MTDRLKQYLAENEDRLSPEIPGERVWEQIRKRSVKKRSIMVSFLTKRTAAACIVLLVGIGVYVFIRNRHNEPAKRNRVTSVKSSTDTVHTLPSMVRKDQKELPGPGGRIKRQAITQTSLTITTPGRKEIKRKIPAAAMQKYIYVSGEELALKYENSFTKLMENEKTMISTTPVYGVTSDYFDIFINDYHLLEADEEKIKQKIKTTGGSLDALDEMIINFQRRIDLLKRLRAEIERKNNQNVNKTDLQVNYVRII